MRDIPIIFSAPMIRALLDGRKTMTRRLAWHDPKPVVAHTNKPPKTSRPLELATTWQRVKPGDRLYVRESHYRYGRWVKDGKTKKGAHQRWRFKAYNNDALFPDMRPLPADLGYKDLKSSVVPHWWRRPAIHHPKQLSRLTLVVTATKIEKLTAISEDDALAEGVVKVGRRWEVPGIVASPLGAVDAFSSLWQYINGEDSWDPALEVVALTFTVHKTNIDALQSESA